MGAIIKKNGVSYKVEEISKAKLDKIKKTDVSLYSHIIKLKQK